MSYEVKLWTAVAAEPSEVFATLADVNHLVGIVDGLKELKPVRSSPSSSRSAATPRSESGAGTVAEGREFHAVFQLGPQTLRQTLTVARLVPGRLVAWRSTESGGRELSFRLEPGDGAEKTRVLLTVTYEVPGGIKGALLKPVVEQGIKTSARSTLRRLKERFGGA